MHIKKVVIENFKCFNGQFSMMLEQGLNVLVGDNESGKSTIMEAIHLTLSGLLNGRYLRNQLSLYLFNNVIVADYLKSFAEGATPLPPPRILIELYLEGDNLALFEGDGNTQATTDTGVMLEIAFSEKYKAEYESLVKEHHIHAVPIEYYETTLQSFARDTTLTPRSIPLKAALIDSSGYKYRNGGDILLSHILQSLLDDSHKIGISKAFRQMGELFGKDEGIMEINESLQKKTKKTDDYKSVSLSVDFSPNDAWENSLQTCLDEVPFQYIGRGEQVIVKTQMALEHKKAKEANVVLIEEPENHLSHAKLNQLIRNIKDKCAEKQILISTHSSFVANKLGLESLVLLHDGKTTRLNDLENETQQFFLRVSGYDTLRLILCRKSILVEGDSDELVVQRAYMDANEGRLPIEDRIDVISVGTAFLRFLEIAEKIKKPIAVITDNDGDLDQIKGKYKDYLSDTTPTKDFIKICFDEVVDAGALELGKTKSRPFNYNTLEPKIVKANSLETMNKVLGTSFTQIDDLHVHMHANKTHCALQVFESAEKIVFPSYITKAIEK